MDAVKFLKKYHKLCDPRSCDDCPLLKRVDGFKTCLAGERNGYEERVVEIVEKWSKEQENKMTRQEAVWHANHVFNLVIERCINAQNLKEAREFDEAKQIVIEALEKDEIIRCKNCRHDNNCEIQYSAQAGSKFFCGLAERRAEQ